MLEFSFLRPFLSRRPHRGAGSCSNVEEKVLFVCDPFQSFSQRACQTVVSSTHLHVTLPSISSRGYEGEGKGTELRSHRKLPMWSTETTIAGPEHRLYIKLLSEDFMGAEDQVASGFADLHFDRDKQPQRYTLC